MKNLPKITEEEKKVFSDFLILAASPGTTKEQLHKELEKLKKIEEDEKISDPSRVEPIQEKKFGDGSHPEPPPFDNPR